MKYLPGPMYVSRNGNILFSFFFFSENDLTFDAPDRMNIEQSKQ